MEVLVIEKVAGGIPAIVGGNDDPRPFSLLHSPDVGAAMNLVGRVRYGTYCTLEAVWVRLVFINHLRRVALPRQFLRLRAVFSRAIN